MSTEEASAIPEKNVTLTLSVDSVNVILTSLGEMPAKVSMSIITDIHTQAAPQVKSEPVD